MRLVLHWCILFGCAWHDSWLLLPVYHSDIINVPCSCWLSLFVNQLLLAVNDCSCCLFAGYVFPFHYPASNVPTLLVAYRGIPIIVACKPLLLHDSEYYPLQYEPTNHFLFQTTCMMSGHAPIYSLYLRIQYICWCINPNHYTSIVPPAFQAI